MIGSYLWPYLFSLLSSISIEAKEGLPVSASAPERDSLSLVDLHRNTNGAFWNNTWDLSRPMDEWFGVTLNDQRCVTNLVLASNNLEGEIPESIGFLIELVELNLQLNEISGSIPNDLGNLFRLETLSLFGNKLTGALPTSLGRLTSLKMLTCARNQLEGAIPTSLGNCLLLERLFLDRNKLVGFLPAELGGLENLRVLDVHNNQIEGPIPSNYGGLKSLRELLLYQNNFLGDLPAAIGQMDSLEFLWLYENGFTGNFPAISNPILKSIRIDKNRIDELPDFSTLPSLEQGFPGGISAEDNLLSFDDILLNFGLKSSVRFSYRPQDTLWKESSFYVNQGDRIEIKLPFDDTVTSSTYKWFKDSSLQQITNTNSITIVNAQSVDEGVYYVEIENDVVGDLRLITRIFEVVVRDSADCDVPLAGTTCGTAPESCSPLSYDLYCGTLKPAFDTLSCIDFDLSGESSWLGFVADTGKISFSVIPYSCSSSSAGIQAAIYKGCQGKEQVVCSMDCKDETITLEVIDPEPGVYYYLAIKSCGGQCKYQIRSSLEGSEFELRIDGQIVGQDSICGLDESWSYIVSEAPVTADYFEWVVGSDTVETIDPELNIQWTRLGSVLMCVKAINDCDTSLSVCKIVNVFPGLKLKNAEFELVKNDSFYVLSFNIEGGIGPIVIDSLSGVYNAVNKSFVSDPILCGKPYHVVIRDKNGCTQRLRGNFICNCTSEAGRLKEDILSTCEDDSIKIENPNGEFLDSTDAGIFALLPSQTFEVNQIITENSDGVFHFDGLTMMKDKVYYVFFIVANSSNNSVDYSDPCLSISNSQPIIFNATPVANAGPDTFYCQRVFNLRASKFNAANSGEWEQIDGPVQAIISNENAALTAVEVLRDGLYSFSWREYNDCEDRDTIEVEIRPELDFSISGPDTLCAQQIGELVASGSFASLLWTDGDTNRRKTIKGPGRYCATAKDALGCVRFRCFEVAEKVLAPVEIMGETQLCEGDETILQVIPIYKSYSWNTGDSSFHITVDSSGQYCITVENFDGCLITSCVDVEISGGREFNRTDTLCYGDTISIGKERFYRTGAYKVVVKDSSGQFCDSLVNLNLVVYDSIYISDKLIVRDDGTGNGSISVDIRGGLRPFKYMWSNGSTSPFINNLVGDVYTLKVIDARDCEATFSFDVRKGAATTDLERSFLSVTPNPLSNGSGLYLNFVFFPKETLTFQLFQINGKFIDDGEVSINRGSNSGFIPMEDINGGVYLLRISDSRSGEAFIQRIVVAR